MSSRVGLFLLLVCLIAGFLACRRNQPSLVDSNRAPDTELWYAPPESTEYEYLVHLYWRGIDQDGVADKYIWTITDTIVGNPELRWNPAERLRDFQRSHLPHGHNGFSLNQYDAVLERLAPIAVNQGSTRKGQHPLFLSRKSRGNRYRYGKKEQGEYCFLHISDGVNF